VLTLNRQTLNLHPLLNLPRAFTLADLGSALRAQYLQAFMIFEEDFALAHDGLNVCPFERPMRLNFLFTVIHIKCTLWEETSLATCAAVITLPCPSPDILWTYTASTHELLTQHSPRRRSVLHAVLPRARDRPACDLECARARYKPLGHDATLWSTPVPAVARTSPWRDIPLRLRTPFQMAADKSYG
jgi:hypothetical protein